MICPNATSPININENKHKKNKCDLKCEFSFNYSYTSIIAKNKGEYLSLQFDPSPTPPVIYNSKNYNVGKMRIFQPSLHTWNNTNADAEIIIEHISVDGTENLLVCIPILSKSNNVVNEDFENILKEIFGTANSEGSETTINLSTFSLNQIVLRKPYYNYIGSLPYSPCNGSYNYVVYPLQDAIHIQGNTLQNLQNIITNNNYETLGIDDKEVFYNSNGPTTLKNGGEDNIYIECKPTGSDDETVLVVEKKTDAFTTFKNQLAQNTILKAILGAIVFIVILVIFSLIINKIFPSGGNTSLSS